MSQTIPALLGVAGAATLALACGMTGDDAHAMSDAPVGAVAAATFHEDGRLARPAGYRTWVFVGAPITPNDQNDGAAAFPEFHHVFVDPASYEAWKATGEWRDGAVVLKELASVGATRASSGAGYFAGEITGLEAAVKSAARFPDEPGNWGYFRFTDEEGGAIHDAATLLPAAACAACHRAAAQDDLVFTQYYPMLREAKSFGPGAPEDC